MYNFQSDFVHQYTGETREISDNTVVYHYTSPEGFLGILKGESLRFTDIRYMNDKSERVYFVKLLLDFLEGNKGIYPNTEEKANQILAKNDFDDIRNLRITNIKYKINFLGDMGSARTFVFCACTDNDSLNMWNYYVKNGSYQGYNIGFATRELLRKIGEILPKNDAISVYYGKVIYSEKQQLAEIQKMVETIEAKLETASEKPYLRMFSDVFLKEYIDLYGAFYKHPKFAGEKEYRFVVKVDNWNNENKFDFKGWLESEENIEEDFCIKKGLVAPYLKVPFYKDAIKRVTLSPMIEVDIAKQGIEELIYQKKYQKFDVRESKIPLRY